MAKNENIGEKSRKVSRGKKRKHESNENEDSIANKSLIIDQELEECSTREVHPTNLCLKRKSKTKETIAEKRAKKQFKEDDFNVNLYQPTKEELMEVEKPANIKNILTNRKKKKQKHTKLIETQKDQTLNKEIIRNEDYLKKWKESRKEWKFEKLRQVSIQRSAFDEAKISKDLWPLALEYLTMSQGASKKQILKLAEEVIRDLDKECSNISGKPERHKKIISSSKYQRARELLQNME